MPPTARAAFVISIVLLAAPEAHADEEETIDQRIAVEWVPFARDVWVWEGGAGYGAYREPDLPILSSGIGVAWDWLASRNWAFGASASYLKPGSLIAFVPRTKIASVREGYEDASDRMFRDAHLVEIHARMRGWIRWLNGRLESSIQLGVGGALLTWDGDFQDYVGVGISLLAAGGFEFWVAPQWSVIVNCDLVFRWTADPGTDASVTAISFPRFVTGVGYRF